MEVLLLCKPDLFGSQLHQSDYVQKGTPIITVEHLGDNRINEKDVPKVSDEDKERLKKYTLKEGDIVFIRVGSVDRRSYVRKEENGWLFSGRCLRVRVEDNNVNPFCLSYFFGLESFKESVRQNAVGATMHSINTQILSNMEITLPPLPTQKKIAKVLGDLDDKIELNRRMNETLEEMAMAVYRHYFVNFGLPPGAKEEATECPFGKLIEHPEMGMIPEGWSVGKLGDVVSNFDNKRIPLSKNQKMSCVKKNIPIMELHQSWIMLMNIFLMEFTCY